MIKDEKLNEIIQLMSVLHESEQSVLVQRIGQEVDHDAIVRSLTVLSENITTFKIANNTLMKEVNYLPELLEYLNYCCLQLKQITEGLAAKANNRGKYGFFKYKNDLKIYRELKILYQQTTSIFQQQHQS